MSAKLVARRAGGGRGVKASIATLQACDSRDPFMAFQSLRSLLEGIGNSKKGMSPSEHKLTLQLLDIVEPFIGATPFRKELINQPNEVLDEIAFHVDSKRDLLAFALTCDRMYRVIHPRHFEYRVIRARITSIAVWQHLVDNRALARGVRQLEILDSRSREAEITPSQIGAPPDLDPLNIHAQRETLFLKAIAALPTLTNFTWSCSRSLIDVESLWNTLISCRSLTSVEILDSSVFSASPTSVSNNLPGQLNSTPSLRAMKIHNPNCEGVKNPSLDHVSNMLIDRCPNLETLDVTCNGGQGLPRARVDGFISQARWLQLRALTLKCFWCAGSPVHETLASFLYEHQNLETLCLDVGRLSNDSLHLLPDTLPRLKEMTVNKELARAIMVAPLTNDNKRSIEVIKGVGLSGLPHDQLFFDALKMYEIKRVELDRFNDIDDIRHLVECVPHLIWLDVGLKCNYRTGPLIIPNPSDWAMMLSPLQELMAFHGLRLFYDSLTPDKESDVLTHSDRSKVVRNNETANVLAWRLPKLRRLDHWEEGGGKIVVLVREGEKVRWEVRRTKA